MITEVSIPGSDNLKDNNLNLSAKEVCYTIVLQIKQNLYSGTVFLEQTNFTSNILMNIQKLSSRFAVNF